ncbi:hypothetical protein HPP92_015859 [Vanilla planifolia]|uniref:Uncharacterized protein n=1 Tax=Vanilla planifolia TaxID=51239 RepID=A0A835QSE2_VANPL|nr:hypothetical protein HPP92_015859 [Vanilla planifolia]
MDFLCPESPSNLNLRVVEKVLLYAIPSAEACVSLYNIFSLLEGSFKGDRTEYHDWLYKISQLLTWVTILLVSRYENCNANIKYGQPQKASGKVKLTTKIKGKTCEENTSREDEGHLEDRGF